MLNESQLTQGEWIAVQTEAEDVKLQAVKFLHLKEKQFVSIYPTTLPGPPRETKHCGEIPCPMVAYKYLQSAAGIGILITMCVQVLLVLFLIFFFCFAFRSYSIECVLLFSFKNVFFDHCRILFVRNKFYLLRYLAN